MRTINFKSFLVSDLNTAICACIRFKGRNDVSTETVVVGTASARPLYRSERRLFYERVAGNRFVISIGPFRPRNIPCDKLILKLTMVKKIIIDNRNERNTHVPWDFNG